ncbi:MAG: FecR family protein [Bdellovibrionia bacterium]
MKTQLHLLVLLLANCGWLSWNATPSYARAMSPYRLDELQGCSEVLAQKISADRLEKTSRSLRPGEGIQLGETLVTAEGCTARVLYPDESKVEISAQSEFQIEEEVEGTQWNRLKKGRVRGIIQKIRKKLAQPRFLIRTKAAILGVRGTDFVMELNSSQSSAEVHTLEGSVEVAKDEFALLKGEVLEVAQGKFIQASPREIGKPQDFNREEFLKTYETQMGRRPPPKNSSETQEASRGGVRFASFRLGAFWMTPKGMTPFRTLYAAWSPRINIPGLSFVRLGANVGFQFAPEGNFESRYVSNNYQAVLGADLLGFFFIEGAAGVQIWRGEFPENPALFTLDTGIHLGSWIEEIFIGYQLLQSDPPLPQFHAGIVITLF